MPDYKLTDGFNLYRGSHRWGGPWKTRKRAEEEVAIAMEKHPGRKIEIRPAPNYLSGVRSNGMRSAQTGEGNPHGEGCIYHRVWADGWKARTAELAAA